MYCGYCRLLYLDAKSITMSILFRFFLCLSVVLFWNCQPDAEYDLLIRNGTLYDGLGGPPQKADIGLIQDQIVSISAPSKATAKEVIDATGKFVAPGFIDIHTHLDPLDNLIRLSDAESQIRQGVTTSFGGPDGRGVPPGFGFKQFLDSLEKVGVGINVGFLAGHNKIRKAVMQLEKRSPTPSELDQMQQQVAQAMEEGAFGISTGLKYLPGNFSETDELIALSQEVAKKGGIYTSHLRDEGLAIIPAMQEAIEIAKMAQLPVILTHHKVIGKPMWGQSVTTLALVDSARQKGLKIFLDQYPYNASHTGISVLIPTWARAGGQEAFLKRIADPKTKAKIEKQIIFNILNDRGGDDLRRIQFSRVAWKPELEGRTLYDWAIDRGMKPSLANGAQLVIEAQSNGGAGCIFHAMDEADVERIMKHPMTMIASDGRLSEPGVGHPHPRAYGTFPRVLGRYVRDKKLLIWEQAIHKMTGFPAKTMGLTDRGVLKVGMKADIAIFDPNTVLDNATFTKPHQYPSGIEYVIVNGKLVVVQGVFTSVKAGKVLRKKVLP